MTQPLSICLETFDHTRPGMSPRITNCVAMPAGQPGLSITSLGQITWQSRYAVACDLNVAHDGRLVIHRYPDTPPMTLRRGGRTHEIAPQMVTVVLPLDEIEIGQCFIRVQIHGEVGEVTPPEELPVRLAPPQPKP